MSWHHRRPMTDITLCCGTRARPWLRTDALAVSRCPTCGTLWASHLGPPLADATWREPDITPIFLDALARRRVEQAEVLVRRLPSLPGPILDYGCGQAVFFDRARRAGLDVWGADLSLPTGSLAHGSDRYVELPAPWTIPPGDWRTVVLLDVLEHHPDPRAFLSQLQAEVLVVKTPLITGPVARTARALARVGRTGPIESLFLVGEANPHRAFFSARGLRRVAGARRLTRRYDLAEVGSELPERMTGRSWGPAGLPLRGLGLGLGAISPIWPDTGVFVFET